MTIGARRPAREAAARVGVMRLSSLQHDHAPAAVALLRSVSVVPLDLSARRLGSGNVISTSCANLGPGSAACPA